MANSTYSLHYKVCGSLYWIFKKAWKLEITVVFQRWQWASQKAATQSHAFLPLMPPQCLICTCLDPTSMPNPWKNMKTLPRHTCMSYNTGRMPNNVPILSERGFIVGFLGEKDKSYSHSSSSILFPHRIHLHAAPNDLKIRCSLTPYTSPQMHYLEGPVWICNWAPATTQHLTLDTRNDRDMM